jgi:hypothetical protein
LTAVSTLNPLANSWLSKPNVQKNSRTTNTAITVDPEHCSAPALLHNAKKVGPFFTWKSGIQILTFIYSGALRHVVHIDDSLVEHAPGPRDPTTRRPTQSAQQQPYCSQSLSQNGGLLCQTKPALVCTTHLAPEPARPRPSTSY